MSDNKIVGLHGAVIPQGYVSKELVKCLEELLERAKSGEVVGMAWAALHSDKQSDYGVIGRVGMFSMLGALDCAHAKLVEINTEE